MGGKKPNRERRLTGVNGKMQKKIQNKKTDRGGKKIKK